MYTFVKNSSAALIIFIACCFAVSAHTVDKNQAQLNILNQQVYQLTITLDALHLAKNSLNFQGDDAELKEQLAQLSLSELKTLLNEIKQKLSTNSAIIFDGKAKPLAEFHGLSVAEFKTILMPRSPNETISTLTTSGRIEQNTNHIALRLAAEFGDVILTVARPTKSLVGSNSISQEIPVTPSQPNTSDISQWQTAKEYLYQGYIHIVPKGLDHILFVLALFLLAKNFSTLLWQISAFTLAHTITLALGIFGIINIPSSIVEPIIALSIAYVAIENIYQQKLTYWRLPLIFAFGLLHGLGFASVLLELGLQPEQFITSLVAFNIGVEIGQLSVVLVAFAMLYWFYRKPWYHRRVVTPLSALIAIIALYWFIERIV